MVTTDNCLIDLGMVQSYPGFILAGEILHKNSPNCEDLCLLFQALWLCLTWSQVSRSITSLGFRSSWVNSVISVTINRPVLLEHSKRRGWTSRISCCSLQYSPFGGTELRNHVRITSLGGRGSQEEGMLWSHTFCDWHREFSLPTGPRTLGSPGPRPQCPQCHYREVRPAP